ncbi:MAG: tetratricopeptide repeat protein [Desulfobacterales bacterium]
MKRILSCGFIIFLIMLLPGGLLAASDVADGDSAYSRGGLDGYKQAIELYEKALADNPDSYEANWKCARAYREYGNEAKSQKIEGWKDICAKYGKTGMQYAQKATELEPNKPDGHYYYGLNVGIYSDGVSIFTALSEGLKDKTQTSFEKAYAIDKMYKEAGPMLSLGRFWAVLPWPMRDRKKSLQYYREYQATQYFADNLEAHFYIGEVLYQIGGDENKAEAKDLLEKAAKSEDPFFRDKAQELLTKIK